MKLELSIVEMNKLLAQESETLEKDAGTVRAAGAVAWLPPTPSR